MQFSWNFQPVVLPFCFVFRAHFNSAGAVHCTSRKPIFFYCTVLNKFNTKMHSEKNFIVLSKKVPRVCCNLHENLSKIFHKLFRICFHPRIKMSATTSCACNGIVLSIVPPGGNFDIKVFLILLNLEVKICWPDCSENRAAKSSCGKNAIAGLERAQSALEMLKNRIFRGDCAPAPPCFLFFLPFSSFLSSFFFFSFFFSVYW